MERGSALKGSSGRIDDKDGFSPVACNAIPATFDISLPKVPTDLFHALARTT